MVIVRELIILILAFFSSEEENARRRYPFIEIILILKQLTIFSQLETYSN
jgi:hypothetical protein